MTLRVDDTKDWPVYKKAFYKFYRPYIENPKRVAIRERILSLPPLPVIDDKGYSIHCLICNRDIEMLICSARTVAFTAGFSMPYIFHDDGSLTDEDEGRLLNSLPGSKVIRRKDADERASEELSNYPNILRYRASQVMALKLVDVRLWGVGERFGYIDSDIVFLKKPEQFLMALTNENPDTPNLFNKDIDDAYVVAREKINKEMGVSPYPQVNAGLWVMCREDICLDTIEEWLGLPVFQERPHFYTLDQTFISMLANRSDVGAKHFDADYDVDFLKPVKTNTTKHYVGRIRHGFETEGLLYLLEEKSFENDWCVLVDQSK